MRKLLAVLPLGLILAACSAAPTAARNPLEVDAAEYPRLFNATVEVLRNQGYVVDRQDYRFGRITAKPRPASTGLEPWRGDNTTSGQVLESTFNAERRLIAVSLEPVPSPHAKGPSPATTPAAAPPLDARSTKAETYLLRVEVQIERQQHPERQLTGSVSGNALLGTLTDVPGELRERGITGPYWQPLGRDPYLEERLLAAIVRQSLQASPAPLPPASAPAPAPAAPARPPVDISKPPPTEGV